MGFLKRRLRQFKEYDDIAEIGEIARRYFVMNAFDGILTIIGVLTGSYAAHVESASVVISTGLATSIALQTRVICPKGWLVKTPGVSG
jgi:hypothetical protein